MARTLRPQHHGAVCHAYNRGVNCADIFFCDEDRLLFLALLAEAVRRFRWVIHQYTLMTNHFHLMIETPEPTLSRGMKFVEGSYVQALNRRRGRSGPLLDGRFKSQLVEKETYLLILMRYIANNPVRARMVERAEEYRWGSHRAIAGFEEAPAWINTEWALERFGKDMATQRREYRKFVDAGAGITRAPWKDAVGQILIGSPAWVERMRGSSSRSLAAPIIRPCSASPRGRVRRRSSRRWRRCSRRRRMPSATATARSRGRWWRGSDATNRCHDSGRSRRCCACAVRAVSPL